MPHYGKILPYSFRSRFGPVAVNFHLSSSRLMLRFRSPLLQTLPRGPKAHAGKKIMWRFLILAVVVGLILWACWAVVAREFDLAGGLGAVAYGFHDKVYLPLRGWTLTRFYPYSLIPWVLFLVGLGSWIYTTVSGIPLFRGRHLRWMRWALRRPGMHPLLLRSARLLTRLKVRPAFMRSVLAHELSASVQELADAPVGAGAGSSASSASSVLPARISGLLKLRAELDRLPGIPNAARFETLCLWQQSQRLLRLRVGAGAGSAGGSAGGSGASGASGKGGGDQAVGDIGALAELQALAPQVLEPFVQATQRGTADFTPGSLAVDLLRLAIADGSVAAEAGTRHGVREPLAELRRRVLDRLSLIEDWSFAIRDGSSARGVPEPPLPATRVNGFSGSQCGRLFVDLALDLAARLGSATLARELLDPLDGLRFLLRSGGSRVRTPNREALAKFLDQLPRPADYRTAAVLDARSLRRLDEAVSSARIYKTPLFSPEDLEKARQRAADLALAAGPSR